MATAVEFAADTLKEADDIVSTERCSRCGGLLVAEECVDHLDDTGRLRFQALRCVQCGELVDPLILRHRQGGAEVNPARRRARHVLARPSRSGAARN